MIAGIALLIGITAVSLSAYMVKATEKSIFTAETFKSEKKADCILILGAGDIYELAYILKRSKADHQLS